MVDRSLSSFRASVRNRPGRDPVNGTNHSSPGRRDHLQPNMINHTHHSGSSDHPPSLWGELRSMAVCRIGSACVGFRYFAAPAPGRRCVRTIGVEVERP